MEARKSSRRFKVGEISEHDCSNFSQNWRISGPEVADGAKPDVPTTDVENEKNTRNFQKFSSDDGNESLQSSSPSLPHWIQHTGIRDENRDFGKSGEPT